MTRELITTWTDYQAAIDRLLATPAKSIRIFDHDLAQLHLESPGRIAAITEILRHGGQAIAARIAVRSAQHMLQRQALILKLASTYAHTLSLQEMPACEGRIRDSMILLDDRHALIRFDQAMPRSKLLLDEPDEVLPYQLRFEEIWREEASPLRPSLSL